MSMGLTGDAVVGSTGGFSGSGGDGVVEALFDCLAFFNDRDSTAEYPTIVAAAGALVVVM